MAAKHYDVKTFTSQQSIGYLLKMSQSLVHDRAAAAFAGHDLSFMQWIALMVLREKGSQTASELCRYMRHDNGALTRMLDLLEERGYVQRERSEEDRRVVKLQLTAAGKRKVTELMPLVVESLNETLADFSKAEFAELLRLLDKLVSGMRAWEARSETAKTS
jgi:DNA-binding MarR family transcriptional regulator